MAGIIPAVLWPAQALAKVQLRFVHALPGAGEGELKVVRGAATTTVATTSFAHVSHFSPTAPGSVELELVPAGTEKAATTAKARLKDGAHYTVVALPAGTMSKQAKLLVLQDGHAKAGVARLRVVHAAPELGSPDLELDGKTVAKHFPFGAVSPYLDVPPGKHDVKAMKKGDASALLALNGVTFKAGTAATAVVVGTQGKPVSAVLAPDDTVGAKPAKSTANKKKAKAKPAKIKTTSSRSGEDVHVVRRGECLWHIAEHQLGDGASNTAIQNELVKIWNRNKGHIPSGDPNLIQPGLRLDVS